MEINRTDTLGLDRSRYQSPSSAERAVSAKEQAAETQKQAIAPPAAATQGAQAQGAAGQNSQPASTAASTAGAATQMATTTTSTSDDDSEYQAVLAKLNSGQALTAAELSVLRANDPARYSQAMQAQTARSQLHQKLEEDPAHAVQTARQAIAQLNEDDSAVLQAMQNESAQFAAKYDQVDFSRLGTQQAAQAQVLGEE